MPRKDRPRRHWEILGAPHIVYRFWRDKKLLYIGCTYTFGRRLDHHVQTKPWFEEVTSITLERYPDFLTARMAETKAIAEEKPKHN